MDNNSQNFTPTEPTTPTPENPTPTLTPAPVPEPVTPTPPVVTKTTGKGWKVAAIVFAILALAVLGYAVYAYTQNKTQEATISDKDQQIKNLNSQIATLKSDNTTTPATTTPDNSNYVVIDTWGVKFNKPTDGTTISWAQSSDDANSIGFTTNNLTQGALCAAKNGAAGTLTRSTTKFATPMAGGVTILNNGAPINGYYYEFAVPNGQHCDNTKPSDEDEAKKIQGLITSLSAV